MDGISAASAQNIKQTTETFVLKKAMEVAGDSVLSLVGAAVSASPNQTNNPPNLGNRIDVRA